MPFFSSAKTILGGTGCSGQFLGEEKTVTADMAIFEGFEGDDWGWKCVCIFCFFVDQILPWFLWRLFWVFGASESLSWCAMQGHPFEWPMQVALHFKWTLKMDTSGPCKVLMKPFCDQNGPAGAAKCKMNRAMATPRSKWHPERCHCFLSFRQMKHIWPRRCFYFLESLILIYLQLVF